MVYSKELIKAKLLEKKNKNSQQNSTRVYGDGSSFPFWRMNDGGVTKARFLPDADPDNVFFWVERQRFNFEFNGVVGGDHPTDKTITIRNIPCIQQFGMKCPVMKVIRPWWDQGRVDDFRKYNRKLSYVFQGFVVSSDLVEENPPENPIRKFTFTPQVFKQIEAYITDDEYADFENPTDHQAGCDFLLKKSSKGQFPDWSGSKWAPRTRSLSEDELEALDNYPLFNLSESLGPIPSQEEIDVIKAMFDASLAGEPFDVDSFGKYYQPFIGNDDANESSDHKTVYSSATLHKAAVTNKVSDVVDEGTDDSGTDEEVVETPVVKTTAPKKDPREILDRIRNRANNSQK